MIRSFWDGLFQGRTVSFREGNSELNKKLGMKCWEDILAPLNGTQYFGGSQS